MKKVGEILKQERLKQNKKLEDISQETKIQVSLLAALENAEYKKLPDQTYIRGFIVSYAHALGLQEADVLPFYRREIEQTNTHRVTKIPLPIDTSNFKITPMKILIAFVSTALTIFLIMLFIQYRNYAGVPVLAVTNPSADITITNPSIEVSGRTDPEASVTINGESVPIEVNGYFTILYQLEEGANRIKITAISKLNKTNVIERVVEYKKE